LVEYNETTEEAKAMEYQEYPDIQPIEKDCLEGNGGNFFNHHEKKTDFSASFYSLEPFLFFVNR